MKSLTRTILAGSLVFAHSIGSDAVSYLQGIKDQGGTFADVDPISVSITVLVAMGSVYGGLMLLLAEPPAGKTLVNVQSEKPKTLFNSSDYDEVIDLGPHE